MPTIAGALSLVLLGSALLNAGCSRRDAGSNVEAGAQEATGVPGKVRADSEEAPDGRRNVLRATIDTAQQRVDGRFDRVAFQAERLEGDRGRARFWTGDDGASITVTIDSPKKGAMEWQGVTYDGHGPISKAASEKLTTLGREIPTAELALIPLDLACRPGAAEIHPAVGAALLMPFQVVLKYGTTGPQRRAAIQRMARRSRCQYFRMPFDPRAPARVPSPSVAMLSFETPIPMVWGYFPLDGHGEAR